MKKLIIAILMISNFLLLSGCRTQSDLHSDDYSSISSNISTHITDYRDSDNNADIESIISQTDTSTIQSPQQTTTESQEEPANGSTLPSEPTVCQHTYRETARNASCSAEGYIQYTCTKCQSSYQETISAQHDFLKYLCDRCGKIDPEADKFWAMNAWLSNYGEPNGKGNMNCYPNDFSSLQIANYLDENKFFIDYYDSASDVYFSVYVQGADMCTVSFSKGSTRGSYEIKNSALSSSQKIVFDDFYTPEENPVDQDVFATECAKKIDEYMLKAQNEIIYPKTGLKLKDFGFTNY